MKSLTGSLLKNSRRLSFFHFLFVLFAFFLLPFTFAAAVPSSVSTYDQLLQAIRATQHASQERIEQAAEQEKVRESWETGKLIDVHILQRQERADYDKEVMPRLAKDLEISESELYRMLKFSRMYPSILAVPPELSWGHIRELMPIEDSEKRKEIAKEAAKQGWSQKHLRKEIKNRKFSVSKETEIDLPEVKPGKIGVYRIVERDGKKYYDLGLSNYFEIKGETSGSQAVKNEDFYTYEALVTQVVDGDSFHARINLGFGFITEQRVRLLRVDAAEIETGEGKEAKAYLEKLLGFKSSVMRDESSGKSKSTDDSRPTTHDFPKILLKIYGEDQHGRPLVIVWANGKSVEQALLDEGLAVRMEE